MCDASCLKPHKFYYIKSICLTTAKSILFICSEYMLITQFNNENDNVSGMICKRCKSTTTVTVWFKQLINILTPQWATLNNYNVAYDLTTNWTNNSNARQYLWNILYKHISCINVTFNNAIIHTLSDDK